MVYSSPFWKLKKVRITFSSSICSDQYILVHFVIIYHKTGPVFSASVNTKAVFSF